MKSDHIAPFDLPRIDNTLCLTTSQYTPDTCAISLVSLEIVMMCFAHSSTAYHKKRNMMHLDNYSLHNLDKTFYHLFFHKYKMTVSQNLCETVIATNLMNQLYFLILIFFTVLHLPYFLTFPDSLNARTRT